MSRVSRLSLRPTEGHGYSPRKPPKPRLYSLLDLLRGPLRLRVLRLGALFLLITSRSLPLAKQHEEQGGETRGGRGCRSKLIPHVPQEETLQTARTRSASGRAAERNQTLRALWCTFPHFSPTHCCALNPRGSI